MTTIQIWTAAFVVLTFALYIGIAIWARVGSTKGFYVAGGGVHPVANGMATAADWMSAASFISMAGLIAFMGRDGTVYLMGWTGGYVLLALLLAPYLRKFGKFTVPDFIGARYYSNAARLVALLCAIFVSFTYIAGQMRGVGIVFSRFLEVPVALGVIIGMCIVFTYAVLGGMKGITYTQVAQYCVLIFAFTVPIIFISLQITGNPIPQLGLGGQWEDSGKSVLQKLDGLCAELGLDQYTAGRLPMIEVICITLALMVGTAGLPHVIIRFFTVPRVRDARVSAGWALLFIALLYTTASAVAAFAMTRFLDTVPNTAFATENADGEAISNSVPRWVKTYEDIGLVAWMDKNDDGLIQYTKGAAFVGKPKFKVDDEERPVLGKHQQRMLENEPAEGTNEIYVDRDIMVLANPEIYGLPPWVIALVAAGGLAAALSTAAGLLLVISSSISHDLLKQMLKPDMSDKQELAAARMAAVGAILVAGFFGIYPPAFVGEVVAFAFGLAASSFFPAIILGIFWKRMNKEGAVAGMVVGILFTGFYIINFQFLSPDTRLLKEELWGISAKGIGAIGMVLNFIVSIGICLFTAPPPDDVQDMVENIRLPERRGETIEVSGH